MRMDGGRWVIVACWPWWQGWVMGACPGADWDWLASQACHGTALMCGTPCWFSWWPSRVLGVFGPWMALVTPAVCACRPLPAASLSSHVCDHPVLPFPCLGWPTWPCLMWVFSPGLCWPVASLRWGGAWGALCVLGVWGPPVCGGSVLTGWLAALGCVAVGVSTSECWGCQSIVPGVLWGCPCARRPLVVTSCGGPWWPTCAFLRPTTGCFEPCLSWWRAATPQHRLHSVALASRGCTLSVPLCLSASVHLPSAVPWGCALVCLASRFATVLICWPFCCRLSVAAVACWMRGSSHDFPSPALLWPPLWCACLSGGDRG